MIKSYLDSSWNKQKVSQINSQTKWEIVTIKSHSHSQIWSFTLVPLPCNRRAQLNMLSCLEKTHPLPSQKKHEHIELLWTTWGCVFVSVEYIYIYLQWHCSGIMYLDVSAVVWKTKSVHKLPQILGSHWLPPISKHSQLVQPEDILTMTESNLAAKEFSQSS